MISEQETAALLTPAELAARLKVTQKTIRNWHLQGRIPAAVAVGRVIRFDGEEVAEALRQEARNGQIKRAGMMEII